MRQPWLFSFPGWSITVPFLPWSSALETCDRIVSFLAALANFLPLSAVAMPLPVPQWHFGHTHVPSLCFPLSTALNNHQLWKKACHQFHAIDLGLPGLPREGSHSHLGGVPTPVWFPLLPGPLSHVTALPWGHFRELLLSLPQHENEGFALATARSRGLPVLGVPASPSLILFLLRR